jgi:hypothetical protein
VRLNKGVCSLLTRGTRNSKPLSPLPEPPDPRLDIAVEMLVGLAGAACLAAVTLSLVGRFASALN